MTSYLAEDKWDDVLKVWAGAKAEVWAFHPSLRRFVIALSRPDTSQVLCLMGVGARTVRGPFAWSGAALSLTPATTPNAGACISDPGASFELKCTSIVMMLVDGGLPIDFWDGSRGLPESTG
jgi:hypothetical protein